MRLRVADRILVCLAGIILLACCAGIVAQVFFGADLVGIAGKVFASESVRVRIAVIALAVLLLLLGIYCVFVLFRHRKRKDKFILQKNESGELAISVKALENMVQKCLEQHHELKAQNLYLENRKDGLLIRIRGTVSGGISIPLTVESLQKQIRQYVTACSGVEVKGIRVQIESSGPEASDAPFAIAPPSAKPLLREAEEKPVQPTVQAEAQKEEPEAEPKPAVSPARTENQQMDYLPDDEDDRPLHQRLFSTQPEQCIIPEPPEEARNAETENEAEAPAADAGAEPAESLNDLQETETEPVPEAEPAEPGTAAEQDHPEADAEFVESLKAFDAAVTGEKKEMDADE